MNLNLNMKWNEHLYDIANQNKDNLFTSINTQRSLSVGYRLLCVEKKLKGIITLRIK